MKAINKIILGVLIGIGIGNIINIVFCCIYNTYLPCTLDFIETQPSILLAVVKSNIVYGLIGVISNISSYIYDFNSNEGRYNLALRTFIHFLIISLTIISACFYLKWIKFNITNIITFIIIFVFIYIIIWLICYINEKKQIKEINKKIAKAK